MRLLKSAVAVLGMMLVMGMSDAVEAGDAQDTLVITARIVEIPGTFPPNDLYNYVYVMKYRVLSVVEGEYEGREIYVGHYNPRIPRAQIKDQMASVVAGDVERFEVGAQQQLTLVRPLGSVWNEATEDEFFDIDDDDKYFAIRADILK